MRAIIRSDLDGIVCATLLKATGLIDTVEMVRIRDVQEGRVDLSKDDILCNLPYHPDCYLWFDHHSSEAQRIPPIPIDFRGAFNLAPSTAGVVYQYFLPFHPQLQKFEELVRDTDIYDGADLTLEDVENPQGNILLGFLLDPRTRMDADLDRREQYYAWKHAMPDLFLKKTTAEILAMPETREWIDYYWKSEEKAIESLRECSRLEGNVIISDFLGKQRYPVNRFVIYTLPEFAEGNISVQVSDGMPELYNEVAVGHSIFNRTSMVDVGDLCAWYGGGGHRTVAVCRPSPDDTDQVFREIIGTCQETKTA